MWSTRNKETLTRNKKSKYLCLGIFLIILGIFLITIGLGIFLIIIGVILLLAGASSKSGGIGKSSYITESIMKKKEYCPKCGVIRYSRFSTKCVACGYIFISDSRQVPTILNKKAEEPKKTSDEQIFPPISDLLQCKETSKSIPSVSELKTEEKQTAPSTSDKEIEKSFTICPHCRQKLPLGAKFCAKCGQKVEVLKPIPPMPGKNETNSQIILDWVKYQYYDLGRSIQEIADELGHSMIRIRKLLYRSGIVSEKEEVESITEVLPPKIEDIKPVSSSLQEKVEEAFKTCPHCRQKLPLGAKFCDICGQKVEVLKPIPPISDIEEELPKETPAKEVPSIPPVLEIEEERPQVSLAEEEQPIPSVYVRKEEKRKREFRVCKFCGMRIPKNKTFCLQCGMIIKIN